MSDVDESHDEGVDQAPVAQILSNPVLLVSYFSQAPMCERSDDIRGSATLSELTDKTWEVDDIGLSVEDDSTEYSMSVGDDLTEYMFEHGGHDERLARDIVAIVDQVAATKSSPVLAIEQHSLTMASAKDILTWVQKCAHVEITSYIAEPLHFFEAPLPEIQISRKNVYMQTGLMIPIIIICVIIINHGIAL